MGIISIKEGYSLVEETERAKINFGTVLTYQDINFAGKPTAFVDLEVFDANFYPTFIAFNILINILAILIGSKVMGTYGTKVVNSTSDNYKQGNTILVHVVKRGKADYEYYDCWLNKF